MGQDSHVNSGQNENASAWDQYADEYQGRVDLPTNVVHYGPDIGTEGDLGLLPDVQGLRVLELGCGAAQNSIVFAKQGATAIGIDFSGAQLAHARRLIEQEEVRVELRQNDMADLAFLAADSIDLVFSAYAFDFVENLERVFRQAHRVLRPNGLFVFSKAHPAWHMVVGDDIEQNVPVRRSYFDHAPVKWESPGGVPLTTYQHTFADLYLGLVRSGFRVDLVLEPEPIPDAPRSTHWQGYEKLVPRTIIFRSRKSGA